MEKYRRKSRKISAVKTLTEAQKIVFAPLAFQVIGTFLDLNLLSTLDKKQQSISDVKKNLDLSEYVVKTLFQAGETIGIIRKSGEFYSVTKLGETFLYDEMTKVNFNFVRDICYLGASELTSSFLSQKPQGLKKFFKDVETIYPILSKLQSKAKKSWFDFDNYYSDNCFNEIFDIISEKKPTKIFDIGANTAKFERLCIKKGLKSELNLIDLPQNIEIVKADKALENCKFFALDVLDAKNNFPKMSGVILMSQFLDCFSKDQILSILKKISQKIDKNTYVYILEPFTDNQIFEGAKISLIHTSLYFTCMANGCSKMYEFEEFKDLVNSSELSVSNVYQNIGSHDYTLLECVKK